MARLTIVDIARMADVSPTSVSFALNGKPGVSKETRKRILSIIEQTGFSPSQSARSQVMKRTQNIALLFNADTLPQDHLFQSGLNTHILRWCNNRRFNLVFVGCDPADSPSAPLPPILRSHDVDGIITLGYVSKIILSKLRLLGIPYLLLDCHQDVPDVLTVSIDYYKAACLAMEHLIKNGHRRIAYIGSSIPRRFSQQTLDGYRKVLDDHHITVPLGWMRMQMSDFDDAAAEREAHLILSCEERPTAIFCTADVFAISAIRQIKAEGFRVPDDISVIAIDDALVSSYIDPPLTTVRIDAADLTRIGCNLLLDAIERGTGTARSLVYNDLAVLERVSVRNITAP